jgi:ABC-2 type transport system permease protein
MFKQALILARKDLKLTFRERTAVISGYMVPIVLLIVFGVIYSGMGGSNEQIKIDLLYVDQEKTDQSAKFKDALASQNVFNFITTESREGVDVPITADDARAMILKGKAHMGLVYEKTKPMLGFSVMRIPVLTLLYDPSSGIEKQIMEGLLNYAVMGSIGADLPKEGLSFLLNELELKDTPTGKKLLDVMQKDMNSIDSGNGSSTSGGGSGNSMQKMMKAMMDVHEEEVVREAVKEGNPFMANTIAGLIVMFLLFSVSYGAASLLAEHQTGALKRIMFAPVSADSIILGKFMSVGLNSFLQAILMLLASMLIFHVNIFGNFGPVLVMTIATVAATTAFGMLLASGAKSYEQVQSMIMIVVLSMSAIGGSMFPRIIMPEWMKGLGLFTINGWAIDGYLDALYRFNGLGSILGYGEAHSFMDVVHNSEALVLLLFAVICSVIAGRLFKRRLAG